MQRACRIVFVCTGNAGRSQIAAALCERMGGADFVVRSAGVEPWANLHPMAVKLLTERGIDLTGRHPRYPKPVSAVLDKVNDVIVTIGDPAKNKLPRPMPGHPAIIHWDISDPADADGTADSEPVFRRTMAMIESRLPALMSQVRANLAAQRSRVRLRPGVGTGMWYPDRFDPAAHLPQAVAAGFAAIELNLFLGEKHFEYRNPAAVRELARVADDLGVEIWSIHEPNNTACAGSVDPAARQKAIDDIKLSLDLAAQLGATAIPSHALLHHTYAKPDVASRDIAVETLTALGPTIRASGAKIAIENGYPDTDLALAAFARLPDDAFGFVIDTGHANISGGNDNIRHIIQTVAGRMISLHLNDNDGKQDSHHPPGGNGCTIDWPAVADLLSATGYSGCHLWEVFSRHRSRNDTTPDTPADTLARTAETSRKLFQA